MTTIPATAIEAAARAMCVYNGDPEEQWQAWAYEAEITLTAALPALNPAPKIAADVQEALAELFVVVDSFAAPDTLADAVLSSGLVVPAGEVEWTIAEHMQQVAHRVMDVFENADQDALAEEVMADVFAAIGLAQAFGAEVPSPAPQAEGDVREALADDPEDLGGRVRRDVVGEVMRDHERRRGGCRCGAEFGDSIDATWHLANQAAVAGAKYASGLVVPVGEVERAARRNVPTGLYRNHAGAELRVVEVASPLNGAPTINGDIAWADRVDGVGFGSPSRHLVTKAALKAAGYELIEGAS